MAAIRTKTPDGRVFPAHDWPGERAEIRILNDSSEEISESEVEIEFETPSDVFIYPDRIHKEGDIYRLNRPLSAGEVRVIPVFIRSDPLVADLGEEIKIRIKCSGSQVEDSFQLLV